MKYNAKTKCFSRDLLLGFYTRSKKLDSTCQMLFWETSDIKMVDPKRKLFLYHKKNFINQTLSEYWASCVKIPCEILIGKKFKRLLSPTKKLKLKTFFKQYRVKQCSIKWKKNFTESHTQIGPIHMVKKTHLTKKNINLVPYIFCKINIYWDNVLSI